MKKLTQQQLSILEMVGTFGFLRTRDVAQLAWPSHQAHSAHVMAQTAVTRLAKEGLLLARDPRVLPGTKRSAALLPPPRGVTLAYVLTAKGADVLNEHFMDDWVMTSAPADQPTMLWFSDGYDLSLKDYLARAPVIDFCQFLLANASLVDPNDPLGESRIGVRVVGPRGAARNFLGLREHTHAQFDALVIDAGTRFLAGIHMADGITGNATTKVTKLAKTGPDFFIVNEPNRKPQLQALLRCRDAHNPGMTERLSALLPEPGDWRARQTGARG